MQVGRWNHQGANGKSYDNGQRPPASGPRRHSGASGGRSARAPGHSFGGGHGARGGYSGGGYRPRSGGRSRGGVGAFGQTEAQVAKLINKAVATEEHTPFTPVHHFSDFAFDERLRKNIATKGYELPTPIQDAAIPPGLLGRDVVGLAETGTGKTAAFLLPLIQKVLAHPKERILVMAPTRELAVQIEQELAGFAKGLGFRGMVAVGGANINPQISVLRHHPSFVIGTPGRLKDLMERRALDLSAFSTVVLDEADRMLDMGFIDDMRFILGHMNPARHTLFFSATMDREIEKLIGDFLKDPVIISVKKSDTSKNVDQDVVRLKHGEDKYDVLVKLLSDRDFTRVLIFCRTKHGAEKLAKLLSRNRIFAESIHGNKSHGARQRALKEFKAGKVQALVATDVAARGLDIPAVSHVINYDLPSTYEDYVHRIGRTGRASAKGSALTFIPA